MKYIIIFLLVVVIGYAVQHSKIDKVNSVKLESEIVFSKSPFGAWGCR